MKSDINSRDDLKLEIIKRLNSWKNGMKVCNLGTTHTKQGFETYWLIVAICTFDPQSSNEFIYISDTSENLHS